ncbi:MAG: hypothetical protein H6658_02040 [Ardenticatenaceae bacterium]|nr:hypothetical protein [Ardenticatenaceae bacterium]
MKRKLMVVLVLVVLALGMATAAVLAKADKYVHWQMIMRFGQTGIVICEGTADYPVPTELAGGVLEITCPQ